MSQMTALKRVGIVGVPFEKGQKKYGVSVGPAAMRFAGLIEQLKEIDGLDVKDYGDVETHSCAETLDRAVLNVDNMYDLAVVSACSKKVSEKVSQVLRDDRIAVTIGGDHSIGIGTVNGHYSVSEDMILIWVDAHADLNTNKTSGSGSVHGMPVALLVKELSDYWPYLPTMDWQVPEFSIKSLGYFGLRSVDSYERFAIEKYDVPAFAMEDIDKHGIVNSINHMLQVLDPTQSRPIHVSFDIDSLDALEAPSTGTPGPVSQQSPNEPCLVLSLKNSSSVLERFYKKHRIGNAVPKAATGLLKPQYLVRGGLTLREGITLMEKVHATGRLRAVDLVEINPAVGSKADRDRTIDAGIAILRAALGFSRRGTAPRGLLDLPIQTPPHGDSAPVQGRP